MCSYEKGVGVAPDFDRALTLYQQAADKNDEEALYRMALLYREGRGVEQDIQKAGECCRRVNERLEYSPSCVFEGEWKDQVLKLLKELRGEG